MGLAARQPFFLARALLRVLARSFVAQLHAAVQLELALVPSAAIVDQRKQLRQRSRLREVEVEARIVRALDVRLRPPARG